MLDLKADGRAPGLMVADVFAALESTFVANRQAAFRQAVKGESFKTEAAVLLESVRRADTLAAVNAANEARRIAEIELNRAVGTAYTVTDRSVAAYARDGARLDKTQNTGMSNVLKAATSAVTVAFASIAAQAMAESSRQYLAITGAVREDATDIAREIDMAQAMYLERGVTVGGGRMQMTAQAESIMRDGSRNTVYRAEGERAAEYGLTYVLVSAHPSSCQLCSPWQGKVLIDDVYNAGKPDGTHELLSTALSAGLGHPNCRHNWVPYILGFDNPNLFAHDTASAKETAQRYAIEQQQRYNERMIRTWKRKEVGLLEPSAAMNARRKVEDWQSRQRALRAYAERQGLPFYRQYSRERFIEEAPTVDLPESNLTKGWYRERYGLPSVSQADGDRKIPHYNEAVVDDEKYIDRFSDVRVKAHVKKTVRNETRRAIQVNDRSVTERVSVIDAKTGKVLVQERGFAYGARLVDGEWQQTKTILVHNHPNSTTFSPDDIATLLKNPNIETMVVGGHDGTVYTLSIGDGARDIVPKNYNGTIDNFITSEYTTKVMTLNGKGDVVIEICRKYGWRYEKRG